MDCLRRKLLNKSQVTSHQSPVQKIEMLLFVGLLMVLCSFGFAEELQHTKVMGDRVNVRVRPDVNSEIVTQLSSGEDVAILETREEWTKIQAPSHSKCWVNNECISQGVVSKDSVNLRCGPGDAFPVLAQLKKGTRLNITEVFGEWTRVEPPLEFGVWVNSKYLESGKPKEEAAEKEKPEETFAEKQTIVAPIIEEKPQIVSVPEKEITGLELVSYAGKLEDMGIIINRPGTYKLVSSEGKWISIIKSPTLDLNPYTNRVVRIEGVVLAKSSSWKVPVIEAKRLQVIK